MEASRRPSPRRSGRTHYIDRLGVIVATDSVQLSQDRSLIHRLLEAIPNTDHPDRADARRPVARAGCARRAERGPFGRQQRPEPRHPAATAANCWAAPVPWGSFDNLSDRLTMASIPRATPLIFAGLCGRSTSEDGAGDDRRPQQADPAARDSVVRRRDRSPNRAAATGQGDTDRGPPGTTINRWGSRAAMLSFNDPTRQRTRNPNSRRSGAR